MGDFLNPVNGIRGQMERQGIKPRDYTRENVIALREKQRENRDQKQFMESSQSKPLVEWKMAQFKDVKSKISNNRLNDTNPENKCNNNQNRGDVPKFLKKGSLDGRLEKAREAKQSPRKASPRKDKVKEAVPREVAKLAPRNKTNFIASNRDGAKAMSSPRKEKPVDEGNYPILPLFTYTPPSLACPSTHTQLTPFLF